MKVGVCVKLPCNQDIQVSGVGGESKRKAMDEGVDCATCCTSITSRLALTLTNYASEIKI